MTPTQVQESARRMFNVYDATNQISKVFGPQEKQMAAMCFEAGAQFGRLAERHGIIQSEAKFVEVICQTGGPTLSHEELVEAGRTV
jgi:transposase-like protein